MSEAPSPRHDVPTIFQSRHASPNRLIHLIPDELAEAVPHHPLFSYPNTANLAEGFRDVSSRCFANAINRTSWYMRDLLGPPQNFETVAYTGSSHLNVLQGVDCRIFLRAKNTSIDHILRKRAMRADVVPELEELLDDVPVDKYPYFKSFEEAQMDPCLVLHTTGSTGLPKPITWKVGILSTYEAWRTIPAMNGYVPTTEIYQQARRAYTSMPLFHTSGLNAGITWALLLGVTLVYGGPQIVPNASYTDDMHKFARVDASMGAPSLYEDLSRDDGSLNRIKKMHYVVASGGKQFLQDPTPRLAPGIDDWAYFYWHPTHSGIEMRETMDGLFELFLVKDPSLKLYQGIFNTFPDIQEWSMNDLYARHPDPTKSFLYTYQGRKDDIIVLNNGEKIAPALMEATLMSDPLVKGAMVVGKGEFQPAVLIDLVAEPPKGPMQRRKTVERLWPVIEQANIHAPAHGKLDRYHVIFADPKKPISYLGQGKIQRSRTYATYVTEIAEVFRFADDPSEEYNLSNLPRMNFFDGKSIADWLVRMVTEVARIEAIDMDQDLFSTGIDSLQIMQMSRELRFQAKIAGMGASGADDFRPGSIYNHPTLNQLKTFILRQAGAKTSTKRTFDGLVKQRAQDFDTVDAYGETAKSTTEKVQAMFQRYAGGLTRIFQPTLPPFTENMTVILTGSTGSLGSYLLEALCNDKTVSHVICLNRSGNAAERHRQIGHKRGLLNSTDQERVEFLKADLSQPRLGLDPPVYERLCSSVTHVIHNQWPVNFNWVLSSFEPYVHGVRNLIAFSLTSTHRSFLLFVSSVSAVGAWSGPGMVPEEPIYDFHVAGDLGYGQSKLISECLLDQAAKLSGVPSACCRVGIVAGPVEHRSGLWNKHEYIPSIIVSSAVVGAFPITFPSRDRIDWLPVDQVSKVLLEILASSSRRVRKDGRQGTLMYHVVNPNASSWSSLAPKILGLYPKATTMRAVRYDEWVKALGRSADESADPERNPAIRLLDFYNKAAKAGVKGARMLPSYKAEAASKLLRGVGAVKEDWVKLWMQQWGMLEKK
ncbi:MAG: hypothetical protein Q9209_007417 [Squamulea sp. 1 TL-2023]